MKNENNDYNPREKYSFIMPEMMHYDLKLLALKKRTTISAIIETLVAAELKKQES